MVTMILATIGLVWLFSGGLLALALCRVAAKPVPTPFDRQEVM